MASASCSAQVVSTPSSTQTQLHLEGQVMSVNDGDTLEVETTEGTLTVRLAAINAPERDECFHDAAREHLVDSLLGASVSLDALGTDQFGRQLAHLFADDRHVNLEMVSTGLALASSADEEDPHRAAILEAEQESSVARVGLWAHDACGIGGATSGVAFAPDRSVVDPDGPDHENLEPEAVVIVNDGGEPVDLTGWVLRDESSRHRYSFRSGTSLEPGASLTVSSADTGWSPGGEAVWNNDGDMALLLDPSGNVVARWRY
jgi:endonuclease YncB( thermonuclease family)